MEVSGKAIMTQQSIKFKLRTNHCFFAMTFSRYVVKNVKVSHGVYVSSSHSYLNLEVLNLLQVVLFSVLLLFVLVLLLVVAGHFY